MALSRSERLVCLKALRLAEEYYKTLIRQPITDRTKTQECAKVVTALKRAIQNDRTTLFPTPSRCPACGQEQDSAGMDAGEGE